MSSLSAKQQLLLREALALRKSQLRLEILQAHEEAIDRGSEPIDDGGLAAAEVEEAEVERDLGELQAVEAALQRLQEGRHGDCSECGAPIGMPRLLAQPSALRCAACQARREQHRLR